jgi:predicted metalloprotease with PDZ domain
MRAMFERSIGGRGFTAAELEAVTDSVCGCRLRSVFENQVRGSALIDLAPLMSRLGLRLIVDTTEAMNDAGVPLPDTRVVIDFTRTDPPARLVVANPASAWRRAGLRTGDELVAIDGAPARTWSDLRRVLAQVKVGDSVAVDVRRAGESLHIVVPITSYGRPRVRFVDAPAVSAAQRTRRARWLAGW